MANKQAFSKVKKMAEGVTPSPLMRQQVGMKNVGPGRFTFPFDGKVPKRLLLTGPNRTRMTS